MDFSFLTTQSFWIKTIELLLALTILVVAHEFGHFLFAKLFKARVDKFYAFFNPNFSLFRIKRVDGKLRVRFFSSNIKDAVVEMKDEKGQVKKDEKGNTLYRPMTDQERAELPQGDWRRDPDNTEYGIGWIPLGGYCRIVGMVDETQSAADLATEPEPYEFRSKAPWKRLLIMLGGVLFNLLLAMIIYSGLMYTQGEHVIPFEKITLGMDFSDTAEKLGFRDGDIPVKADGHKLENLNDMNDLNDLIMAKEVTVLRNGKETTISIPKGYLSQLEADAKNDIQFMTVRMPVVVKSAMLNQGGEKAGLKEGDRMVAVNGVPTPSFTEFTAELTKNKGKNITLEFLRDGKSVTASNVPVDDAGKLGIQLASLQEVYDTKVLHYSFFRSIPRGIKMGVEQTIGYIKQLKMVFTPEGAKSVGSFGTIGSIFPSTWNWVGFWNITAFISIILAVMNVLPIPLLDGGHVMFLLYEIITGRQPSEKFQDIAMKIGMVLILALMLLAIGNDIIRFIIK